MQNQDSVVKVVDTTNTAQTAPLAKEPGPKHFDFEAVTGLSKGAFKSPNFFQKAKGATDSLNGVIVKLTGENGQLSAKVESLTGNNGKLEKQVENLQGKVNDLQGQVTQLTRQLDSCKEQQPLVNILFTPPGCYVTIVLVIALTIICLKKGFSIAKGDIKITTGDSKNGE